MVSLRRTGLLVRVLLAIIVAFTLVILIPDLDPVQEGIPDRPELYEDFSAGHLDPAAWHVTRQGDFMESIADVQDADPSGRFDYRLRLRLNTLGTDDETVKFLGVMNATEIDLTGDREISFDLDWNNQSNGCYLTGAVYLCPTITVGNPEDEPAWLKFEYVGVPPGQNARCVIATKEGGVIRYLFTEGWPEQRDGRRIGNQRIRVLIRNGSLAFFENGREIYSTPSRGPEFSSAYLYFQVSSHSNYPSREIYFDNILVA